MAEQLLLRGQAGKDHIALIIKPDGDPVLAFRDRAEAARLPVGLNSENK